MKLKIHSAISPCLATVQRFYDNRHTAIRCGASTSAIALLALNCILVYVNRVAGVPFEEIASAHALLLVCLLSVMLTMDKTTFPGFVLSAALMLAMNASVWDWMIAQSDVQTAFDIRTSITQIMVISSYTGVFVWWNRGAWDAFRREYLPLLVRKFVRRIQRSTAR